jgi:hypothetical protein
MVVPVYWQLMIFAAASSKRGVKRRRRGFPQSVQSLGQGNSGPLAVEQKRLARQDGQWLSGPLRPLSAVPLDWAA